MHSQNRFNLIDEPWIPIIASNPVSLKEIFTRLDLGELGGNPIQKIALMKLLLAIAQAAYTPKDKSDWLDLTSKGLSEKCLAYLETWYDCFYLYGERPFLQMKRIYIAKEKTCGALLPEVATGNATVVFESQMEKNLSDSDKALLIITLMGFALGGKKTDNTVTLSSDYAGKQVSGKIGASLGYYGYMHHFVLGSSCLESIWFNLLTGQEIRSFAIYSSGLGISPWEQMPDGENCARARELRSSLMGRLVPLSRFCLLSERGIHYSEGIQHLDYNSGMVDPTLLVKASGKKPTVVWADPEKKPWRNLSVLLGYLKEGGSDGFDCPQMRFALTRVKDAGIQEVAIWCGGLRVRVTTGEQKASGTDDFVESRIYLDVSELGAVWFAQFSSEILFLESLSKKLEYSVKEYYEELTEPKDGKKQKQIKKQSKSIKFSKSASATYFFWELCGQKFRILTHACSAPALLKDIRVDFCRYVYESYDIFCPKQTARQIGAWAKYKPRLSKNG